MIPQEPSRRGRARSRVLGLSRGARVEVSAEAPTLLMPLEASVANVSGAVTAPLDRAVMLLLAPGATVTLAASAPGVRIAEVVFLPPLLARVTKLYAPLGLERRRLNAYLGTSAVLPRTVWVHELLHRYVFERHALGVRDNEACRFLETELLKELYFLCRDREEGADRASTVRRVSRGVERAIAFIEEHLYHRCRVAKVCQAAAASESTLLRAFQRELGMGPGAYWRGRKLDEALLLLRAGDLSVAEVAAQVGYENPTAFGHAFRQRFGTAPSAARPRAAVRPAP